MRMAFGGAPCCSLEDRRPVLLPVSGLLLPLMQAGPVSVPLLPALMISGRVLTVRTLAGPGLPGGLWKIGGRCSWSAAPGLRSEKSFSSGAISS